MGEAQGSRRGRKAFGRRTANSMASHRRSRGRRSRRGWICKQVRASVNHRKCGTNNRRLHDGSARLSRPRARWLLCGGIISGHTRPTPFTNHQDECLHGGGLRSTTSDGWSVAALGLDWPKHFFLLNHPGSDVYMFKIGREPQFSVVAHDYEARAFGFSWTGRTLILADGAGVRIWGRPN